MQGEEKEGKDREGEEKERGGGRKEKGGERGERGGEKRRGRQKEGRRQKGEAEWGVGTHAPEEQQEGWEKRKWKTKGFVCVVGEREVSKRRSI